MNLGWLFSWTMTIAGTSAGWALPFFGLMVYYVISILRPPFLWYWEFDQYNPPQLAQLVAVSTLIGWARTGFGNWHGLRWIHWPLAGLALYLAAGLYATLFCAPGTCPPYGEEQAWKYLDVQLKIGLMALVTVTLVTDTRSVKTFGWVTVVALGYLAESFNEWYFSHGGAGNRYLRDNGWGGIDNNGVAMVMVMSVPLAFFFLLNRPSLPRGMRWGLMVALVPIAINASITAGTVGLALGAAALGAAVLMVFYESLGLQTVCFVSVACMIHTVWFSFSRGGQLGLIMVGVATVVVALVALPRKLFTLSAAAGFIIVALFLAGPEVRERFNSIWVGPENLDASAASRPRIWHAALKCIAEHPMGVGPRNFNLISANYGLEADKSVHNLLLQTAADYGIFGAIGLYLFYIGTAVQTYTTSLTQVARRLVWARFFCLMVTVSIAGMLVCSIFIGMESVEAGFIISLLGLCTVAYVRRASTAEPPPEVVRLPELEEVPEAEHPSRRPAHA